MNAHFETRHQCGLLPTNHATLFESRTGRQRWGGYERCLRPGAGHCATCPVFQQANEHRELSWPGDTPLVLARIRPWPPTPGSFFVNFAAGRSDLHLYTWAGTTLGVETDWLTVRNALGVRCSWVFRDGDGKAFWLVRDNPAAATAVVRTRTSGLGHARHALYAGPEQPRLALLDCDGCSHTDDDLQYLAADLADAVGPASAEPQAIPERLPGVPVIDLSHKNGRSWIRHGDITTSVSWDLPFNRAAATALLAYAVRSFRTF
ncbi:hypothetical protein ACIQU4_27585 [Streptomyces sp. NPDC090741]|uniref:hypothetical protein n=1 Tax=Streptomyces sp. NPDC090741 TaxID=3365967 RepID=UPI00381FF15B